MTCFKPWKAHDIKILFLGAENSGKTTIAKQMRICYGEEFSKNERQSYTKFIVKNIFASIHYLIDLMDELDILYETAENAKKAELVRSVIVETIPYLSSCPHLNLIRDIWQDAGIQTCAQKRPLVDNSDYFLNKIEEVRNPRYLPTDEDLLKVYIPTKEIVEEDHREINFTIDHVHFNIVDVGGLKEERRKWIYCMENVNTVIFVAALSDYDQVVNGQNKLEESRQLFNVIVDWFRNHSIILFMNKKDVFQQKFINQSVSADCHPIIKNIKDYNTARERILDHFLNVGRKSKLISSPNLFDFSDSDLCFLDLMLSTKQIGEKSCMYKHQYLYAHYSCAIDTETIATKLVGVKNAITDTIMNHNLEDLLIM